MSRKFFYSFKHLLCVLLISSFILPVYAENAASDGSAFVTKEEFDKALADFNSRLTSFEAGINSKIDSQVSSYLDRNGIWNGAKQTIKDSPEQTYGFKIGITKHNCWVYRIEIDSTTNKPIVWIAKGDVYGVLLNGKNDDSFWNKNEKITKNGVLVERVTKSGLFFMPLHDNSVKNGDIRCRVGGIGTNVIADDCYRGNYTARYEFFVGDEQKWSKDMIWTSQAAGIALVCPALSDSTVMFFVSKGDKIEWKWTESWEKNYGGNYATSLVCWTKAGEATIRKASFDTPNVY